MKKLIVLAIAATFMAALPLTAASANETESGDRIYVSVGDSVAAGTQDPDPFTDDGYTDALFQMLRRRMGLTEHVNFACPADDTNEMIDGEDGPDGGSLCYGTDAPFGFGDASQLATTVAFLEAHEGEIALITITLGANDLLRCPDPTPECVTEVVGNASYNLQATILPALTSAAPGVPIVAMNYYNPNLAYWLVPGGEEIAAGSNQLIAASNQVLADAYGAYGIPVADVASAFRIYDERGRNVPVNVMLTCVYTSMCSWEDGSWQLAENPDIHPNDLGYRRIAWEFLRTMRQAGIR